MKHLSRVAGGAAVAAGVIVMALLVAGCSTPHAVRVDCDTGLSPVNAQPDAAVERAAAGMEPGV